MYGLNVSFWADRVASNTQLYQHITIDGDTLDFKTYDVTGSLYDSFCLIKQPGRANKFIEGGEIEDIRENSKMLREDGYTEEDVAKYNKRFSGK